MTSRSGFSLLELLVALALLGLIGAGLASAMRLGTETYSRAQNLGTENIHAASRAQFRRLLGQATPQNLLTPFPKEFRGTNNELSFVTLAPLGFARDAAGLRVRLALESEVLIAKIEPFDDDGTSLRDYEAILAEDAGNVVMRYFSNGEWQDIWDNSATLPQLVQIELNGGTDPLWPEFTVELIYAD